MTVLCASSHIEHHKMSSSERLFVLHPGRSYVREKPKDPPGVPPRGPCIHSQKKNTRQENSETITVLIEDAYPLQVS